MMITRTNVRFPRAPIVLPIIDIRRFNVGHDLPNLKTLNFDEKKQQNFSFIISRRHTNRNDRRTLKPLTLARPNSTKLSVTIKISNTFHPSFK